MVMHPADALTNEAVEHLNARRFGEAINTYLRALSADPTREETWTGLALAFTLAGRFGDIVGLADYRQRSRGDGFAMFYNSLLVMMTYQLHDHLLEFAKIVADDSPYAPAITYQSGCIFLLRGDEDRAFERFTTFKRLVVGRSDLPIGSESPFNIAYRQGTLIEDAPYVAALADDGISTAIALPTLFGDLLKGSDGTVLVAACDARYFERYAHGLIRSAATFQPNTTMHIHVADGDTRIVGQFGSLKSQYPELALNFSTETTSIGRSGAYYASMRFLIGPALLSAYRKRLVLIDVDVTILAPLDDLSDAMTGTDFACFRHDGAGPCSRYPAVLTSFASTESGTAMFDLLGRFIRSKLDVVWPFNWMLDQAALASVLRYVRAARPDIKTGILDDLTGDSYRRWLTPIADDAKEHLIRSVGTT